MNKIKSILKKCKKAAKIILRKDVRDVTIVSNSKYFDENYYKSVAKLGKMKNAAAHFLKFGAKNKLNPSLSFSTSGYLQNYPDVAELGMNPLVHYERNGKHEGRAVIPVGSEFNGLSAHKANQDLYSLIKYSEFFDEAWYRSTYSIADSQNAVSHFLNEGFKLGYDPSIYFSCNAYLKFNPDVAASGNNPLVHYELSGRQEFRQFGCR